ncbi:MAG: YicC/YloC family endoribonuclease [Planctomycetota bacterium]
MTGFGAGRAEATLDDGAQLAVVAEVRSVNHRHLQVKLRLPHDLGALESSLEKAVRARLGRGAVQVAIELARSGGEPSFDVDEAACERYLRLQRGIARRFSEFDLDEIESIRDLLTLPGVVVTTRTGADVSEAGPEADVVRRALDGALDALEAMRRAEGKATADDLAGTTDEIEALIGRIRDRLPEVAAGHRARLVERVAEVTGDAQLSEADLAREIAVLADRLDVSEEIARLGSHIVQLRAVLDAGGAVGRRLDFLAQEFFREANTIGSKCSDAAVAHLVVDLKTQVERLREQVQNIE